MEIREEKHISGWKSHLKGVGNNVKSYEILARGDYRMELVEAYCCETEQELVAREMQWIQNTQCINKRKYIGRTPKEIYRANLAQYREYYQVNKEQKRAYQKRLYQLKKAYNCHL